MGYSYEMFTFLGVYRDVIALLQLWWKWRTALTDFPEYGESGAPT